MRVSPSLTIPDEVERARRVGQLVVFAGAGVSMSPPAGMPGFVDLARHIAEAVVPWIDSDAAGLDRYLGKAERQGVRVQVRARERLDPQGRSHTTLHEDLLGLFEKADRVRLITTNFDPFFGTAASAVFPGATIRRYVGPALPPGRDFAGIVQLHGALDNLQDRLVLTDRDFAGAYLADGWATRFLLGVFAQRTVVFVGYGLRDPVIQYLMRAMAPTGHWYALTQESDQAHWSDMDITPIPFAPASDGRPFGELNDGVRRWRWYAQASLLEHDRELRQLVEAGPPTSPQDEDYIRARLDTDAGRVTFWTAAASEQWLSWAADRHYLDALTDETAEDPNLVGWIRWCLDSFLAGERPALLSLLRRRPLTPNRLCARVVAAHLCVRNPLPPRPVLRQMIAWLTNQTRISAHAAHEHVWLLKRLVENELAEEAMQLLRVLTRLRLAELETGYFAYEGDDASEAPQLRSLSVRVSMAAGSTDLSHYLEEHGAGLARLDARALVRLGVERIHEAYELLDLARAAEGEFDWLSYGRTAIAASNQDFMAHAEDVLVLMVRHALDDLRESDPALLLEFAVSQSQASRALLRRLALYAFARHQAVNSDDVLDRARTEGWPREIWVRPELYLVLQAHYPRATEEAKRRFVADLQTDSWWREDQ
jgi:SIR2-like protein